MGKLPEIVNLDFLNGLSDQELECLMLIIDIMYSKSWGYSYKNGRTYGGIHKKRKFFYRIKPEYFDRLDKIITKIEKDVINKDK